jgi:predicted F0F1-ATPase subunit
MKKKQIEKMLIGSQTPQKEHYTLQFDSDSRIALSKRQKQSKPKVKNQTWVYMGLVGDIGLSIVLPLAGGTILGAYIDRHWSTYPKATLIFLFVGMIISFVGFAHTLRGIIKNKS